MPDVARRDLDGATTPVNGVVASIAKALPKLLDPRESVEDFEQIMKGRGYRYIPDPMGRIGEGDWADEHGRRLTGEEVSEATSRISNAPAAPASLLRRPAASSKEETVTIVPARPGVPPRRIESNLERLAYDLDTATAYVKRGEGNIRIAVPTPPVENASYSAETGIPRINAAIREAVVANALLHRSTGPDEIASVVKNMAENPTLGPQTKRSRIRDMLIEAATNGATPEQRTHARGLIAVYEAEEREAKAAGAKDPQSDADVAISAFGAGLNADVSWSVYDSNVDDEAEVELAAEDPNSTGKPRGSHIPHVRDAAREGRQRHTDTDERVTRKGGNWKAQPRLRNRITGGTIIPDILIERWNYLLELKPNTITGRIAGAAQCALYTLATGYKCRVIYYTPSWLRPSPPSAPTAPTGTNPAGSSNRSRGGIGGPTMRPPAGMGSNKGINPKAPPTLPFDPLN